MNNNQIKVIVDAGHGGSDPGAIGNNILEKDLNLRAAQYMYKRLQELGIPAIIIRDSDETLPKAQRIQRVLNAYNNDPNTILISNHINSGGGEGAEIVYSLRNDDTLASMALENIGAAGQKTRRVYQRVLPENPSKDYYYILRETGNTEPLLVEYGFIDNRNDVQRLENNLENYVEGVVKAIADYANYRYTPPQQTNPDSYVVQRGDTLYSIARKYNTTVDELKRINNLSSDVISIGQIIYLSQEPQIDTEEYIVQKGDSLWAISRKYNTTVDRLIELNNLTSVNLQIGDKLLVPAQTIPENTIYVVEKGDTLWSIARKNNISVEELKQLNNLTSNLLSIGQQLIIPA